MPFINLSNNTNNEDKSIKSSEQNQQTVQQEVEQKQIEEKVPQQNVQTETVMQDPVQNVIETRGPSFDTSQIQKQQNSNQQAPILNNFNIEMKTGSYDVASLLDYSQSSGASDLHLTVDYPPLVRIDGGLQSIPGVVKLTNEVAEVIMKAIMRKDQLAKFDELGEVDFSFTHKSGIRIRANVFMERGRISGAFRLLPAKIKTIQELGLPEVFMNFTKLPHGLVLVTGPTGSGKSTTLAAMLNEINLTETKHIISIEDPIEYVYPIGKALIDQREIGRDTHDFNNALRAALRQDPDVVLVGEMRDYETISNTIMIAETGHLAFATLHTNSAAQTIDRIVDVFPEHQQDQIRTQLSVVLQAVISQRLVPTVGGGRVAVHEILIATDAVRNTIREGKTHQLDNIIQTSGDIGMCVLEKSLAEFVKQGKIELNRALEHTTRPDQLKDQVNR